MARAAGAAAGGRPTPDPSLGNPRGGGRAERRQTAALREDRPLTLTEERSLALTEYRPLALTEYRPLALTEDRPFALLTDRTDAADNAKHKTINTKKN